MTDLVLPRQSKAHASAANAAEGRSKRAWRAANETRVSRECASASDVCHA